MKDLEWVDPDFIHFLVVELITIVNVNDHLIEKHDQPGFDRYGLYFNYGPSQKTHKLFDDLQKTLRRLPEM